MTAEQLKARFRGVLVENHDGVHAPECQKQFRSVLLVDDPPPHLLEQEIRAHEEMKQADFLADQAEQLRSSTGLTVQTAFTDGDPEAFIEHLQEQYRQQLLIVTTRHQAEHKVMRFLHQSNVPVLFVA